MANWLDKYEQGGMVLKQKTHDNYGKKANPNNVQASVGPGFVGMGNNTKGRNYSPAWGGQFQMGGSMPGAVGFTYARTQDPAPANGKYAKKTKASAQKGIKINTNDPAFKNIDPSILKNITPSDVNDIRSNLGNYISSDLYAQRQKNIPEIPYSFPNFPAESYEKNKDDYEKNFNNYIANSKQSGRLNNLYATDTKLSNLGLFKDKYKSNEQTAHINKKGTKAVIAHELAHSIFANDNGMLDSDFDNSEYYEGKRSLPSMFLNKGEQAYLNDLIKFKDSKLKDDEHYDPSMGGYSANESYSDLMGFRQLLKDNGITNKFGDNITDKDFQKALKIKNIANDPNFKRMRLKYKDEHIPILNNIIAKNEDSNNVVPQAQNGKEMSFYQNGLDFTPKSISKNGSVIKDDMGQWAHPGEITEINSNNITMQGVPYPVLGISDTGDKKLMKPGKDYKFEGTKVTEYPKGGWLNKYK